MLKSLITTFVLSTLAVIGFGGIAQAQQKCPPPGTSTHGCYLPITPQLPPKK